MTNWKKVKFGEVVEINPTISLKGGTAYSFIEMADLSDGQKFAYPSKKKILTGGARFKEGDTLFARITPCLENGKICQAKNLDNDVGFGSTEFLVFRGKKGVSNSDFVFYLSRTEYIRKYAELNLVGTSGRQRVSASVFYELEIDLPDLPTQTRIASILSAIDDKIELNRQMNHTLEQMAQALFKKYFVDDIDVENLPDGWRLGKLDDELEIVMGQSPSGSSYNEIQNGIPFFQGRTDFEFRYPTHRIYTTEPKRFAKKFDTLLSVRAPVGDINIARVDCCVGRGLAALRSRNGFQSYCYYKLKSLEDSFEKFNGEGTVFGSINKDSLSSLSVIIPDIKIVERFEEIANPWDSLIHCLTDETTQLLSIRDSLLPKLMSGEIEIKEVETLVV